MSPLELVRVRWDAPGAPVERAARAGVRAASLGATALATAGRLRRLRHAPTREGARERASVLREASRRALHLHGLEVDSEGPLPLGAALLASNHVSWLDPLVVASLVPCVPVSKLDVSGWPVIGSIAQELGVVFTRRDDHRSGMRVLRAAQAAFAHGLPVLNFPEGTTTRGDAVLPFRKGLFGIARAEAVPVVPVALAYDPPELAWVGDDLFFPHWLDLASSRRARAFVRLGAPLRSDAYPTAQALAHAAHDEVSRLLGAMP
jgi:1-acyl-sn-glycerol-3-phosphate acyltransferase